MRIKVVFLYLLSTGFTIIRSYIMVVYVARLSAAESFRQVTWPPPKSDARVGGYDFLGGEVEAGGRPRSQDWRSRVTEESEL